MRYWNYRVVEKDFQGEKTYHIFEVYYDSRGAIEMWSDEGNEYGVPAIGESVEELRSDLKLMMEALDKPLLFYDDSEELEAQDLLEGKDENETD